MPRLIALSGSLRAVSSNTALLQAAAMLAPADTTIALYDGIAALPHFNPDRDVDPLPAAVADLRRRIGAADGVLICCPEYARGIPGAFKNALDWLVGSLEFPDTPVALFNASPRSSAAQDALRLVLTTMSARLIDDAALTLPLLGRHLDAAAIAADRELAPQITAALDTFAKAIAAETS